MNVVEREMPDGSGAVKRGPEARDPLGQPVLLSVTAPAPEAHCQNVGCTPADAWAAENGASPARTANAETSPRRATSKLVEIMSMHPCRNSPIVPAPGRDDKSASRLPRRSARGRPSGRLGQ